MPFRFQKKVLIIHDPLDPDYQAFLLSLTAEPTEADKDMGLSGTELRK